MGYSSLHDAVMDADVSHVMTQMSPGDITNAAHVFEAATGEYIHDPPSAEAEATEDGYSELKGEIQGTIAGLVDALEIVNQAEATNDPAMLKTASAALTATLTNSSAYWETQVRSGEKRDFSESRHATLNECSLTPNPGNPKQTEGDGPVPVPWERTIAYPDRGFCLSDAMALIVLAAALAFITTGEKFHKYLICALGMTIGTFAGLFYCAQLGIEEDTPKWSVSLAAGLALWIAVMFVEGIVFNALAMGVGGGACMVGYSIVVQYIPPQPEYYMFITIGVGVVVGYFCSSMVKAAALRVVYSVTGGFLTGSCVSYLFWKLRSTQGDLWLENLVNHGVGLDLTKWQTLTCIGVMVVASFAGVYIQNQTAKKGGKKEDKKKGENKDEEAGYGATAKK
jgi:hypothetical protein